MWHWLRISEKEFKKISARGKCVKCGKPTSVYNNLCPGHVRAYHRWRNKKEREERLKQGARFIVRTPYKKGTSEYENCKDYLGEFCHVNDLELKET